MAEKNKFLFVDEEEGELTDSDEDDKINAKEEKAKRDAEFIKEWSEKVTARKEEAAIENKDEMELVSDLEEDNVAIDTQPLAMSIIFKDDNFARDYHAALYYEVISRFGEKAVLKNANSISVYLCNNTNYFIDDDSQTLGDSDSIQTTPMEPLPSSSEDTQATDNPTNMAREPLIETDNSAAKKLSELCSAKESSVQDCAISDNVALVSSASDELSSQPTITPAITLPKSDSCSEVAICSDLTFGSANTLDMCSDLKSESASNQSTKIDSSSECLNPIPSGLESIAILFHDKCFLDKHFEHMRTMCECVFGVTKVTSNFAIIEIVQNDMVEFEVDTERYGSFDRVRYTIPEEGLIAKDGNSGRRRGPPPAAECFNCGAPHSLMECPQRKNYEVINANREKFRQKKMKMNMRYHAEKEKFSGLSPGEISPALREALGIGSHRLPRHIYQMRKLGYPPGWLQEAKVTHSGVTVYGTNGAVPEDGDEDGEVFEEGEKDRYDIKKLIQFPGFNTPADPSTFEEYEKYDSVAFAEEQSIDKMIERLAPNAYEAYKRRKMQMDTENNDAHGDTEEANNSVPSVDLDSSRNSPLSAGTPSSDATARPITPTFRPLSVSQGTPILPSASPYASLPSRDKFGVNISDVINFENLPNATGTYKKVSSSIAKIREYAAKNSL